MNPDTHSLGSRLGLPGVPFRSADYRKLQAAGPHSALNGLSVQAFHGSSVPHKRHSCRAEQDCQPCRSPASAGERRSTREIPENAEGFLGCRSPHPAPADFTHSLLADTEPQFVTAEANAAFDFRKLVVPFGCLAVTARGNCKRLEWSTPASQRPESR